MDLTLELGPMSRFVNTGLERHARREKRFRNVFGGRSALECELHSGREAQVRGLRVTAGSGIRPRVVHPGDPEKRIVEADAEFVLATSAAAIIYLSKV